jgi:hypothetical protein
MEGNQMAERILAGEAGSGALARLTGSPDGFLKCPPESPVLYRAAGDFRDLLGIGELDEMLASGGRRRPDFRVISGGSQVPDGRYTRQTLMYGDVADPRKIARELAAGATLVMQGLQDYHGPAGRFSRQLGHDLGRPVLVNAYLTPPGAQGFGSHFDPSDAFIIQVAGSKDWVLREPALPRPVAAESWDNVRRWRGWDTSHLEAGPPWQEVTLAEGDVLWLPRGWVHSARSGTETSLHLTLAITNWTVHWAAQELLTRVVPDAARRALPADFAASSGAAREAAARLRADLATWLDHVTDEEVGRQLQAAATGQFAPVPVHSAAFLDAAEIAAGTEFEVYPEAVVRVEPDNGGRKLHLPDRVITIPAGLAGMCDEILGRTVFAPADIPAAGDERARDSLIRSLWTAGIIDRSSR